MLDPPQESPPPGAGRDDDGLALMRQGTFKQVAHQVDKGRKVTFDWREGEEPVTGYVAGWDRPGIPCPCWFVLIPHDNGKIEQQLIPREGTRLTLWREETFKDEALYAEMEQILRHFRYFVVQSVLEKDKK